MKNTLSILVGALFVLFSIVVSSMEESNQEVSSGGTSTDPKRMILLDITKVGSSTFSVGERGVIIKSTDEGGQWQRIPTPTNRSLTKIVFIDSEVGVAVGHGGTVLRTADGGDSWSNIIIEEADIESFLGATVLTNGKLIIYGAFGMYFESSDKGITWFKRNVVYEDFDWHISEVIETGDGLLLAGEAGTLALSSDGGISWDVLESPYEGSFFGAAMLNNGDYLVYGMRGNVYRSSDKGFNWVKVETNTINTLNGGMLTREGHMVIVANNGVILISDDNGKSFKINEQSVRAPLSSISQNDDGSLLFVGAMASASINY